MPTQIDSELKAALTKTIKENSDEVTSKKVSCNIHSETDIYHPNGHEQVFVKIELDKLLAAFQPEIERLELAARLKAEIKALEDERARLIIHKDILKGYIDRSRSTSFPLVKPEIEIRIEEYENTIHRLEGAQRMSHTASAAVEDLLDMMRTELAELVEKRKTVRPFCTVRCGSDSYRYVYTEAGEWQLDQERLAESITPPRRASASEDV